MSGLLPALQVQAHGQQASLSHTRSGRCSDCGFALHCSGLIHIPAFEEKISQVTAACGGVDIWTTLVFRAACSGGSVSVLKVGVPDEGFQVFTPGETLGFEFPPDYGSLLWLMVRCVSAMPNCSVFYLLSYLFFPPYLTTLCEGIVPIVTMYFQRNCGSLCPWEAVSSGSSCIIMYNWSLPISSSLILFCLKNCHICFPWLRVYLTYVVVRFWTHSHKSK